MVSQLLLSSALLVLASAGKSGTLSDTAAFIQASVDGPHFDLQNHLQNLLRNYKPPEKIDHEEAMKKVLDRIQMVNEMVGNNSKMSPEAMKIIRDRMQVLRNSMDEDGMPSENIDPAAGEKMRRALKEMIGEPDNQPQEKVDPMKVLMRRLVDRGSVSKDMLKEAAFEVAKSVGKQTVKNTLRTNTPFGLGKIIVNDKDKEQVHQCSDISSSLYCGMSKKVYGISCVGWGGSSCLDASASCDSITVEGICRHSIERLNVTCLGWGGHKCLPYGATASLITTESVCQASEAKLGIRSLGWAGSACLDKQTVSCKKISVPGICNDAAGRLGIDCGGWSGSECLSRGAMTCSGLTTRSLCSSARKRLSMNCKWRKPGKCTDAIA